MFSKIFRVALLFVLTMTAVLFAAEIAEDVGLLGGSVLAMLTKIPGGSPEIAVYIYTTIMAGIGWLLTRGIAWALKRLPTKWYWSQKAQKVTVSLFWRLAMLFFGKSVAYYHMRAEDAASKEAAAAAAKTHFLKHDPILSIDIKKMFNQ